jgi:hypothetical protein
LSPFLCPFFWRDDNDGDGDGDDDEGDDEGDGDGILLAAQKIVNWLGGQTRTHRSLGGLGTQLVFVSSDGVFLPLFLL